MVSPNVISAGRDDLEARRRVLLERLGMTLEELRAHAETYSLAGDEWEALTELEEIEFLLER